MMTERNFKTELGYYTYEDMEDGRTTETIDYEFLISIIQELHQRIEKLEKWQERAQSSAKSVREHIDL
jgi:hypothetical protein